MDEIFAWMVAIVELTEATDEAVAVFATAVDICPVTAVCVG